VRECTRGGPRSRSRFALDHFISSRLADCEARVRLFVQLPGVAHHLLSSVSARLRDLPCWLGPSLVATNAGFALVLDRVQLASHGSRVAEKKDGAGRAVSEQLSTESYKGKQQVRRKEVAAGNRDLD
jgi:hypothetical protein